MCEPRWQKQYWKINDGWDRYWSCLNQNDKKYKGKSMANDIETGHVWTKMTRNIMEIQWRMKSVLVMFEPRWQEIQWQINNRWNRNWLFLIRFVWSLCYFQWNSGGTLGPSLAPSLAKYAAQTLFVSGFYPVYTIGWTGWLGWPCLAGSAGLALALCGAL